MSILSFKSIAQDNLSYNVTLRNKTAYPGQTLANICGYWANGREYALLGASKGMIVTDITNPDAPKQIAQFPGPDNLWKEIKTYKNYAYVTSEGGQGLQVVNMKNLPSPNLDNQFYTGNGDLAGKLNKIHALHIDTLKGVVYLFGCSGSLSNGAIMLDIKTDPYNPKYLGTVTNGTGNSAYIHDGFAHNDTLYAGHIYRGEMEVYYTGDKTKFVSLGKVQTPTKFTHNIWLSENHKYAFTTDENNNSVLAAYDVSDLSNIKLVDKHSTNPNSGAVVHNTHILNDFAVSSYYTEGFNIVDAHRPDNLVEVARYDSYLPPINPSEPFEGAWGVYPYFPSGTMVISNIDEGLFVVSPKYKRACYLEGNVKAKSTGELLNNVAVKIDKYNIAETLSDIKGDYKTGVADSGKVTVTFSKFGYTPFTTTALVSNGKVTVLNVELGSLSAYSLTAVVSDAKTSTLIKDATITFVSQNQSITKITNANGSVDFSTFPDTFDVYVGKWGYQILLEKQVQFNKNTNKAYKLASGYKDDFLSAMPLGWSVKNTATAGLWVVGEPITTQFNGALVTPSEDNAKDLGDECLLTGNEAGQPGTSDVDNGSTTITSPVMNLASYKNPGFNFDYWFFNGGGQGTAPNDSLYMTIDNGTTIKKVLIAKGTDQNKWQIFNKSFKAMGIAPSANTKVTFTAVDEDAGHLVKAAIDKFEVVEFPGVNTIDIDENIALSIAPNPFSTTLNIDYQLLKNENATLILTDISGKIVEKINLDGKNNRLSLGENLNAGVYFIQIQQENKVSATKKVVKL